MIMRYKQLYILFWRSHGLSWYRNHLCCMHLGFGLFLFISSTFYYGCSSVSVFFLFLLLDFVVVFPYRTYWGVIVIVDDSWRVSSIVLVMFSKRR